MKTKLILINIAKILGIILITLLVAFIIDTSFIALKNNNVKIENLTNQEYVTSDVKTHIVFLNTNELNYTNNQYTYTFKIKNYDDGVMIISSNHYNDNKEYVIKILNDNSIYCEIDNKYMYLITEKDKTNENKD